MELSIAALLRRHPSWESASSATLNVLLSGAHVMRRAPGQVFIVAGSPMERVHVLISGAARAYYPAQPAGPEGTSRILLAPVTFGEEALLGAQLALESVEALRPSLALAVAPAAYQSALDQEPVAARRQIESLLGRVTTLTQQARPRHGAPLLEQVVALLLAYGTLSEDRLHLSQDDLAQQTGAGRRSVARVMDLLYRSGAIERQGRTYAILDRLRLAAMGSARIPDLVHTTKVGS